MSQNGIFVSKRYCSVIGDKYTVVYWFKTSWNYLSLLQLIISCFYACCFTNHSPGYLYINGSFFLIILYIFAGLPIPAGTRPLMPCPQSVRGPPRLAWHLTVHYQVSNSRPVRHIYIYAMDPETASVV